MKHYFYILFAVIMFAANAMAEEVEIKTKEGKKFNGEFRERTDSTLTIYNRNTLKTYTIYADEIVKANTSRGGMFVVENGKIVGHTYDEIMARKYAEEKIRMGNPNYAIGKAMKVAGGVSLGVGVPAFALGTILVAVGQSDLNKLKKQTITINENTKLETIINTLVKRQNQEIEDRNMVTAGLVLMPFGGALTIVGIPLYVRGKNIMSLSLQVSENGAGVAVKF